ncbi:antibiotic biosynthesis monooxygenase family protein [Glaciimonas soli]|uniref:Antibiotic biosynthesis monooxygenase n=1 Tax=Glaciimonas soli TaxID=2590999 RepID=A0A843YWQ9_9BURK|nr:antibiotic biosynthesis monooxygenase [Glaciimonas soli]MQR01662.1 antibiotic biosynthesis monooxygenase [Glaciimonas soli]
MSDSDFAKTPKPPYYAVIFTSLRTAVENGYGDTADRMVELAATMPGYLGVESVRDEKGFGITVSYWENREAISHWRVNAEHRVAQESGKRDWYEHYEIRVALVERAWSNTRA